MNEREIRELTKIFKTARRLMITSPVTSGEHFHILTSCYL